jgi:hypothetical protein
MVKWFAKEKKQGIRLQNLLNMKTIKLFEHAGSFAENKDVARSLRIEQISPLIKKGDSVTLDFSGVDSATQSFVHALVSDLIREYGNDVLDKVSFKNCNQTVQKIIEIVVDYMQSS